MSRSRNASRQRGAAMIEALLVAPLVMFILSLVIYFGHSMVRFQRATMMDRYEAWRSAARAPGPSVDLDNRSNTSQMSYTFFRGDTPSQLAVDATVYFPAEPGVAWENAVNDVLADAADLADRYNTDLPRGRSIRFYVQHTSAVPLWQRIFSGSIVHRHTVMDTQWRFVNQVFDGQRWYNDSSGTWSNLSDGSPPTLDPGESVRETFYADFDRRLDNAASNNPLGDAIQDFYLLYPPYKGPVIALIWEPSTGWY